MTRLKPRNPKQSAAFLAIVLVAMAAGLFAGPALFGGKKAQDGLSGAANSPHEFDLTAAEARGHNGVLVGRAKARSVAVYRTPHSRKPYRRIAARTLDGHRLPLVFLIKARRGGWVNAYLPTRPNLSTGFIRTRDLRLATDWYRMEVQLRRHRLVVWRGGNKIVDDPIAVGKAVSPTPTGHYYVTDLIRPPDPRGFYGPYAFGLSAHSKVFTTFEGGDGQVGIHGTNNPSVIGGNASHGCIRVRNRTIRKLAKQVPIGTPVRIER